MKEGVSAEAVDVGEGVATPRPKLTKLIIKY